jgi:hypothetical protein
MHTHTDATKLTWNNAGDNKKLARMKAFFIQHDAAHEKIVNHTQNDGTTL